MPPVICKWRPVITPQVYLETWWIILVFWDPFPTSLVIVWPVYIWVIYYILSDQHQKNVILVQCYKNILRKFNNRIDSIMAGILTPHPFSNTAASGSLKHCFRWSNYRGSYSQKLWKCIFITLFYSNVSY